MGVCVCVCVHVCVRVGVCMLRSQTRISSEVPSGRPTYQIVISPWWPEGPAAVRTRFNLSHIAIVPVVKWGGGSGWREREGESEERREDLNLPFWV